MPKTNGPEIDETIPVRLTADEWDHVCESLANRRRHRFDVIRDKIVDQTVAEAPEEGVMTRYRFTYRLPGQRVLREGVADLLGDYGPELTFSGRPVFGTMTMQRAWIESIEVEPDTTECFMDKRA